MPLDLLVEPDDVTLDGIVEATVDLFEGRLPAKAMVVPRIQDRKARDPEAREREDVT